MKIINPAVYLFTLIIPFFFFHCDSEGGKYNGSQNKIKFKQYLVEGKRLYLQHCSNCHQKDGTGLARLYPPLKKSDYFKKNEENVICIIKNGQSGEIIVNDISFNHPMPGNPRLTNLEIAEISTYIITTWGSRSKLYTHIEVSEILEKCESSKN